MTVAGALPQQAGEIVKECDDHQADHHDKAHLHGDLPETLGKRAAFERFERVIYQTPTVEHGYRQQIQHTQAHADQGHEAHVGKPADGSGLPGVVSNYSDRKSVV